MPIESLPSKNAAILDVPEVQNFQATFEYNYWTADEFENGLGSSRATLQQIPSETFEASYVGRTRRLPRLVKLNWTPSTLNRDENHQRNSVSIRTFLNRIHAEETFTSNDYTTFHYQDTNADQKLRIFVDKFTSLLPDFAQAQSPNEIIDIINANTSDRVTAKFLAEIVSDLSRNGVSFTNQAQAATALIDRIKNVALNARLNNRLLVSISRAIRADSVGIFADEIGADSFQREIQHIQDVAITTGGASLMSPLDYEFEVLSYVGYRPIDTNGYKPAVQAVGYTMAKREVKADGSIQNYPSIIIENAFTGVTFDGQVRYQSVYYYKIRAIYLVEVHATDEVTRQNILVSFLVASKYSPEQRVNTVENIPPPPPADFNCAWDFGERALRLTWNLPTNPQQDIKYIQLFRRASTSVPFQLIKMWDFNDTRTIVPLSEYPQAELVERVNSFVGIHLDHEFGKDSNFIYAVACTDAHGFTSNYSLQMQASFDKFANKLVKKLVSVSGAPKQYPNAYLNADTFVDTIKDSGHTRIRVVFNPEFLHLVDGNNADLKLIKTNRVHGKYRLQLINVDLQAQQNADITINDLRPTTIRTNLDGPQDPAAILGTNFLLTR